MGYFSEQLDSAAQGWQGCLQVVADTTLLAVEASKLALGQHLECITPHHVSTV